MGVTDHLWSICNDTNGDEDVTIQEELGHHAVYLNQVIISVPNHITMHESKQSVAAHTEVRESATFPEDGHTKEGVTDKEGDHADQSSSNKWSRLDKTCKH